MKNSTLNKVLIIFLISCLLIFIGGLTGVLAQTAQTGSSLRLYKFPWTAADSTIIKNQVSQLVTNGYNPFAMFYNQTQNKPRIYYNGTWRDLIAPPAVATPPAGANTQVQYNNSGVFGASNEFAFTSSSNLLELGQTAPNTLSPVFIMGNGSTNVDPELVIAGDESNVDRTLTLTFDAINSNDNLDITNQLTTFRTVGQTVFEKVDIGAGASPTAGGFTNYYYDGGGVAVLGGGIEADIGGLQISTGSPFSSSTSATVMLPITNWDMDANQTFALTIPAFITSPQKIATVQVIIYPDTGTDSFLLSQPEGFTGTVSGGVFSISGTTITLARTTSGRFDSTSFDSVGGFVRGYAVVNWGR